MSDAKPNPWVMTALTELAQSRDWQRNTSKEAGFSTVNVTLRDEPGDRLILSCCDLDAHVTLVVERGVNSGPTTAHDLAKYLADQLREMADMIEGKRST